MRRKHEHRDVETNDFTIQRGMPATVPMLANNTGRTRCNDSFTVPLLLPNIPPLSFSLLPHSTLCLSIWPFGRPLSNFLIPIPFLRALLRFCSFEASGPSESLNDVDSLLRF
jgi:hypothetical protein